MLVIYGRAFPVTNARGATFLGIEAHRIERK